MAEHTRQAGGQSMFSIADIGVASLPPRHQDGIAHSLAAHSPHPGLVAGSVVWTSDGAIAVEYLAPGDRVVTRNAGLVAVTALHIVQYGGDFIQIAAQSLGKNRPDTDTILPATQTVLVRGRIAQHITGQDTALVAAERLGRIPGVTRHDRIEMTLVQLVFDRPQLVYADGLETLCLPKECARQDA